MKNNFAAGIVPYIFLNDNYYFLLGFERSYRQWSGFIGNNEKNEIPIQTAFREFHEETSLFFTTTDIQLTSPPLVDQTTTGKNVYIWFVQFPNDHLFMDFSNFRMYQKDLPRQYKEKSALRWFSKNDLYTSNIYKKMKKICLSFVLTR